MDQVKVIYQNGMLEELNIETVILSGITVMSRFIDNEYVLHIHALIIISTSQRSGINRFRFKQ